MQLFDPQTILSIGGRDSRGAAAETWQVQPCCSGVRQAKQGASTTGYQPILCSHWTRLFWATLHAAAFAWTLISRRLQSRARRRTGITGGGMGRSEGGGCRANFLGVLPLKQFKNINHIGSRWLLERCSHTAGTVAGARAACPGQESQQQGLLWLEERAGSQWARVCCCF